MNIYFNSLSSPEVAIKGLLNGPVPLAFTAATFTEYSTYANSHDMVKLASLGIFMLILSSDPTLAYWIT